MSDWVTDLVTTLGYWGIAFLMFLENVFPPIPSELIMPLAGFETDKGELTFFGIVVAGSIGSLAGAYAWYWLGAKVGEDRLRRFIEKHGNCQDLDEAKRWLERHGAAAVLIGRMVPGIRTVISLPAGLARMPQPKFLFYSAIGTFLWTLLLAFAGRVLASRYDEVKDYVGPVSTAVLVLMIALYVWRLFKVLRRPGEQGC
jgi:membrane protein DedA with SNARE-associated domain